MFQFYLPSRYQLEQVSFYLLKLLFLVTLELNKICDSAVVISKKSLFSCGRLKMDKNTVWLCTIKCRLRSEAKKVDCSYSNLSVSSGF